MSIAFTVVATALTVGLFVWAIGSTATAAGAENEAKARGPFFGLVLLFVAGAVAMRFLGA